MSYRPSALDLALAPERTVAAVGPVADLDEGRMRATLDAVQRSVTPSRAAVIPTTESRTWPYNSNLADVPIRKPGLDSRDLGRMLTAIRNRTGPRAPLEINIVDDYLVVDYTHGIGDGQFGLMLLAALPGDVDTDQARSLAVGLPPRAAWTALRRHYGTRPAAVSDVMRLRRNNKKLAAEAITHRVLVDWQRSRQCRTALMDRAAVAELRTWAKTGAAGASTASVTMALWLAAVRAARLDVDEKVLMLVNCRRYLDPKHVLAQGNFAVALPVRLPPSSEPAAIGLIVRDVVESGWPIAVLAMAEMKALVKRPGATQPQATVDVPDRTRLAVSDLGRLAMFDTTTWAPGRAPQVAAFLDPAGPDAVSLLVSELAGARTFTTSFYSAMVDPAVVERALRLMCDDPVGTLRAALVS